MSKKQALRFDNGKLEFHNLHPDVLRQALTELIAQNKEQAGELVTQYIDTILDWFYYKKPIEFDLDMVRFAAPVLDYGAKKYAALNYTHGMIYSRVFNSGMRHIFKMVIEGYDAVDAPSISAFRDSEDSAAYSGLPHIGHVACNLLFAYTYRILGYDGGEFDDRPNLNLEVE